MRKEHVLIALLAALALLSPVLLFGCVSQSPATPSVAPSIAPTVVPSVQPSIAASVSPSPAAEKFVVVVTINNGTANYSKQIEVAAETSVLQLLEENFVVAKKEYSFGALVTGIDGLEQNDSTQKYWQYYVDGTLASVGAGGFKIEKNVSVEWRYETPQFA